MYSVAMLKTITVSAVLITTSALALPAYACGFHGGGFGLGNADWQPYNPRVSTQDPSLLGQNADNTPLITPRPVEKTPPSFSNVANRAAFIAKARVAKKAKDQAEKTSAEEIVKKTASNTDR